VNWNYRTSVNDSYYTDISFSLNGSYRKRDRATGGLWRNQSGRLREFAIEASLITDWIRCGFYLGLFSIFADFSAEQEPHKKGLHRPENVGHSLAWGPHYSVLGDLKVHLVHHNILCPGGGSVYAVLRNLNFMTLPLSYLFSGWKIYEGLHILTEQGLIGFKSGLYRLNWTIGPVTERETKISLARAIMKS